MRNKKLLHICIAFTSVLLLTGCLNTVGSLEIKGKVIDEYTKIQIPGREIIVQGLVKNDEQLVPVYAGQFSTDSSGCFTYTLRKVKDARYYNFCLVGDSDYTFTIKELGLLELEQNAKYLSFSSRKLTDFTIKIYRKSKTPVCDTVYLSWKSDGVDGKTLYPYKMENYGLTSNLELNRIGGNVKATIIKTRVFADKRTTVRWVLFRNKKSDEITDTITCKRDLRNIVYFTY
jgi:hypothetical protein